MFNTNDKMNTERMINIFNRKANEWLDDLKMMDDDAILIKPTEKYWCMSEVYDHVMRVSRDYQIPNLKQSLTALAERKKRKNAYGNIVFNLGFRKNIYMKMEEFPKPLVTALTPIKRKKNDLVNDFSAFIKEVNDLEEILNKSNKDDKQYHPMFGDITTKEWFRLIELHIWQHDKQREKIKKHLKTRKLV